jgi:predicted CXXCH cytochrome family protein
LIAPDAGPGSPEVDADVDSMFWPDGTVRVGGREYNGLVASACFLKGKGDRRLSCGSCHAMHASEPAGQLALGKLGDEACLSCHEDKRGDVRPHTHHAQGSLGSRCVSCHMPPTTYALLKAIPSHRIDSPKVAGSDLAGRPPACNLCHLDRTLAWTASLLEAWYGAPPAPPEGSVDTTPSGAAWLLAGNAAQRVIVAAAMGSEGARAASGGTWEAPLLERALADPYAAVRLVVARSLRALPGSRPSGARTVLDREAIDRLVAKRDDRAITISE